MPKGISGVILGDNEERCCTCHFRDLVKGHGLPIGQPVLTLLRHSTKEISLVESKQINHQSRAIDLVIDDVVAGGSHIYISSPRTLHP